MKMKTIAASGARRSPRRLLSLAALLFAIAAGFANSGEAVEQRYGEYSFDTSISNAFWCTWGWVAPAPAESTSAAIASFDFSGTETAFSSEVSTFYREPRGGCIIVFQ